jgi:hypothetical protein
MERWVSDTGQLLLVHNDGMCWGPYCPIHEPSPHALVAASRHWRDDRGIMERICDHGIGHPDPDDWKIFQGVDSGTHGCDGCCRKVDDEPGGEAQEAA